VRAVRENAKLFSDEEQAMVDLGLGKNMVRSVRFWVQATGMATTVKGGGHALTKLGKMLLGERGFDPFLEDIRTLWLIHWNLSTDAKNPLLAWDFLLNRWQEPKLVPSVVNTALFKEATRHQEGLSPVTVVQHWETFLHTYFPTRGRKGQVQEDNLDSPLTELQLVIRVGERSAGKSEGRAEPIYAFRREEKPDISDELFVYSLNDFWNRRHASEATLSFREVVAGHGSPGQIFKLPEEDIRARVERMARQTDGFFSYAESANLQQVNRRQYREPIELLEDVYRPKGGVWLKSA
jgi:hypothetical protein